jgi:hypothetical protein
MVETENVDGFFRPNSKSNVSFSKFRRSKAKENGQAYGRKLAHFAVREVQAAGHRTVRR